MGQWLENKNHVYIGRNARRYARNPKPIDTRWGNPFPVKMSSRETCIQRYEDYARKKLIKFLPELTGKELGCWCSPLPCHGDVLQKLYKEFVDENGRLKPQQ